MNDKKIFMWSGPRNISTTMMYSFAQRSDTTVEDEPLYGYYLANTSAKEYHPGAIDIMNSLETNGEKVMSRLVQQNASSIYFYKNMTHHLLNLDLRILLDHQNIILTRDPVEMLPSFDKVIHNPTMDDVGYEKQSNLLDFLLDYEKKPIVIEARKVLKNPVKQLKSLCKVLEIPFSEKMLHWKKGPIKEDGIWAKYWYSNIHNSTGFNKYKPKDEVFPEHLFPLLQSCQEHYKKLLQYSI